MKLLVSSFLQSPLTSFFLDPYNFLSVLFSNTHSLCSSLSVTDVVSHPYKTTGYKSNIEINKIYDTNHMPLTSSSVIGIHCHV
jgi:hypothetical protein